MNAEARAADLRKALLDQLAYLIDEVEGVKPLVDRLPASLQEARPRPGDPSLKELYGLLAALDETVYLPRLRALLAGDDPAFETVDEAALAAQAGWNDRPLEAILTRVQDARRALVAFLRTLPPGAWQRSGRFDETPRDVYGLVHHITQHDVDLLRAVALRLHESHPLPK